MQIRNNSIGGGGSAFEQVKLFLMYWKIEAQTLCVSWQAGHWEG